MLFLICMLMTDGAWHKLEKGGQVFLVDDHIAHEVGVDFNFDRITWSGKLVNDVPEGKGKLKCFQGKRLIYTIKGRMKQGVVHDPKSVVTTIGIKLKWKYSGTMEEGVRKGEGRMDWVPVIYNFDPRISVCYEGTWDQNDFNGFGIYTERWKKYEGGFKNGRYHGKGTLYELDNRRQKKLGDDERDPNQGEGPGTSGEYVFGEQHVYFKIAQEGVWDNGVFVGKN